MALLVLKAQYFAVDDFSWTSLLCTEIVIYIVNSTLYTTSGTSGTLPLVPVHYQLHVHEGYKNPIFVR